jgi:hypothetical protein
MIFVEQIIRRVTRMIGWEIGSAIESVIWSVGIGIVLLCCCGFGAIAVAYQIMFNK